MNELKKAIVKAVMACDDMAVLRLIYTFITNIIGEICTLNNLGAVEIPPLFVVCKVTYKCL